MPCWRRHHNINVNVISPGSISSGRVATHTRNGLYGAEAQERLVRSGSLDRFGTVEECASVAAFLVGPMADCEPSPAAVGPSHPATRPSDKGRCCGQTSRAR